ncbi:MAG: hypothetical protein JRC86_01925, partial [Deltaproteobacteria bacterium]|nr:hypothetical protein [Deltaproteobacteria bacterium]
METLIYEVAHTTIEKRWLAMQPSDEIRASEAVELFKKVLAEFGVLLDFEIVEGVAPASFTWGKVLLPRWYLKKPKKIVLQTLRHEVGHRIVFPGKPDWEKLAMKVGKKAGVTDLRTFVNVVADWFVDYELLKKYGEEYYSRIIDAVREYKGKDPRFWLVASVYQLMAQEHGIKTPDIVGKAMKLCKDGEKVVEKAMEAYKIITSGMSLETKIELLARLLKEVFHLFMKYSFEEKPKKYGKKNYVPAMERLSPSIPLPESSKDNANPVRDPQWLAQKIVHIGVENVDTDEGGTPAFLVELGIGDTGSVKFTNDEIVIEATRLKLYAKYVEAVERIGSSGAKVEVLEQWTIGDLPHELRVEETLRVYGEVLPPVFSLKYSEKEEPESGTKGGCVIIVLDCSGSMRPSMKVAKQAAFSILQEARKRGD